MDEKTKKQEEPTTQNNSQLQKHHQNHVHWDNPIEFLMYFSIDSYPSL